MFLRAAAAVVAVPARGWNQYAKVNQGHAFNSLLRQSLLHNTHTLIQKTR